MIQVTGRKTIKIKMTSFPTWASWTWHCYMLHVQVGKVYLAGPPEGHKVALPGAAVSAYFQSMLYLKYQGWKYLIGQLICLIRHEWPVPLASLNTRTLQARRQLEQHCHTLESTEGNSVQADLGLLRKAAFEFVWQKLEEKHDAWRTARAQPTRLQALLCALLWVLFHYHYSRKWKFITKMCHQDFQKHLICWML